MFLLFFERAAELDLVLVFVPGRAEAEGTVQAECSGILPVAGQQDAIRLAERFGSDVVEHGGEGGFTVALALLGLRDRRAYPYDRFWEIAAAEGCDAILGRDAHDDAALSDAATEAAGRAYAARFGLHLCETVELRPVKQRA